MCCCHESEGASIIRLCIYVCLISQISDHDKHVQMANLSLAHLAQPKPLSWIQRLSRSENTLFTPRLEDATGGLLRASLDDFTVETSKETGVRGIGTR